ncbi:Transcription initiation factor IIA large subunit [Glycine soja]|nr:Transcription initiation factor IIA large subunit [Glycine soja]
MSADLERSTSRIPQLDGPIPYDDDVLSTPNIYNYGEVFSEDYNISNTPAPPGRGSGLDKYRGSNGVVLLQIQVARTKSRWKCTLKDGIMHINNKDILFNKATGEFEF